VYRGARNPPPAGVEDTNVEVRVTVTEPPEVTTQARSRVDLGRMLADTAEMAAAGRGRIPEFTGPVAADLSARRQYSFSRLSGQLRRPAPVFDSLGGR